MTALPTTSPVETGLDFVLNGERVELTDASPNVTLLQWLRQTGRTGTKEGCAEGDCGACSVLLRDRKADDAPAWRSINSCLIPLTLVIGREIWTAEGLGKQGALHPVQEAMVHYQGSQCGYCTPGFICSMAEGYYRDDLKTEDQVRDQLCGNLCRCTGYRSITDAARSALRGVQGSKFKVPGFSEEGPVEVSGVEMLSPRGNFFRPETLEELFARMAEYPQAKLVAGATELGLELTKKFKSFATMISLEGVTELTRIEKKDGMWHLGAAATLTRVEEATGTALPALTKMLRWFGSRQIRNRATLGGNLVTASPIGDTAPVLIAYGASVVLASAKGERTVLLESFFKGYRQTVLEPGEVMKTVLVPEPVAAAGKTLHVDSFKVSKRREMDISTVSAAFWLETNEEGFITTARLVYGGVAATTARARMTESYLEGRKWTEKTVREAQDWLKDEFKPLTDVRGTAEYRRGLILSLLEKFYRESPQPAVPLDGPLQPPSFTGPFPQWHESAEKHVSGHALYIDDVASRKGMLELWPVCAPHAHATLKKLDVSAARTVPGVVAVLTAADVPGVNNLGAHVLDETLLAEGEVLFHGHMIAVVIAPDLETCRAGAAKIMAEYEPLPAVLTVREAIARQQFHSAPHGHTRGNVTQALTDAPHLLEGEFEFGGQEHFYLESQAAWAESNEDGGVFVSSSTQHPSEVQHLVARTLGLTDHKVVVECPRMGGGFGGKESQAASWAALAALAAVKTGHPCRMSLNRDHDMMLTGKRHPFYSKFKVGFDATGKLLAADVQLVSDGGWCLDLSQPVLDRALFHLDNAYYIPNVKFQGLIAKTNLVSNTAYRGFGGPQGMLVMEEILSRIADTLGRPPEEVRAQNFYHGTGESMTTHYGQLIEDFRVPLVWDTLMTSSEFAKRKAALVEWNTANPTRKRGLAITPVKFGISFTFTQMNQAGALVLIYQDGTIQVNHGGTEMGQGLHTKILGVVQREIGVSQDRIRVMHTATDKVPNTSPTAASAGSDLNGFAVKNALDTLKDRLRPVAVALFKTKGVETTSETLRFEDNSVNTPDGARLKLSEVLKSAYAQRISLSTTGFYATPGLHYDRSKSWGKPFHYFSYGACAVEVEVDALTGQYEFLRTDILHDVGDSLSPGIDRGQIEGGYVQGVGWLTCEELKWNDQGVLLTHSPDTYKIPAIGDMPRDFRVSLLEKATQANTIHGSKAVGEPPFMLGLAAREALRDAVRAFAPEKTNEPVLLASPSTPEAVFLAVKARQA